MGASNGSKAVVKRGVLGKKKLPERINLINAMCSSGSNCAAVSASQPATAALTGLKAASAKLGASLTARDALLLEYRTACVTVQKDATALNKATATYMNSVDDLADGNAQVITDAGLTTRDARNTAAPLARPENLRGEPGKVSMQAIARWDAAAGASAYKLRVNFTQSNPAGWVELSPGRSRRRVITAPTPAAQFLVCVASIGDEISSDWSDPIMMTAR